MYDDIEESTEGVVEGSDGREHFIVEVGPAEPAALDDAPATSA